MAAGKAFRAIGGILVLVATFGFAWMEFAGQYVSGISVVQFQNFLDLASASPENAVTIYIMLGLFLGTVISGLMILIGIKVRFLAILFSLFPMALSIIMIIAYLGDINSIDEINLIFGLAALMDPVVDGILPYFLEVYEGVTLGMILLASGGLVGLIGGLMSTED